MLSGIQRRIEDEDNPPREMLGEINPYVKGHNAENEGGGVLNSEAGGKRVVEVVVEVELSSSLRALSIQARLSASVKRPSAFGYVVQA